MRLQSMRTYSELCTIRSYEGRYEYLRLGGVVAHPTFGPDRYLNQIFYSTPEWESLRNSIIVRDFGCDMGMYGYEIKGAITIHHMNPIEVDDLLNHSDILLNPEYLICVSDSTHKAIHYGTKDSLEYLMAERCPGDTTLWHR